MTHCLWCLQYPCHSTRSNIPFSVIPGNKHPMDSSDHFPAVLDAMYVVCSRIKHDSQTGRGCGPVSTTGHKLPLQQFAKYLSKISTFGRGCLKHPEPSLPTDEGDLQVDRGKRGARTTQAGRNNEMFKGIRIFNHQSNYPPEVSLVRLRSTSFRK